VPDLAQIMLPNKTLLMKYQTFANFDFKAGNHRWRLKNSRTQMNTDKSGSIGQEIIKKLVKNLGVSVKSVVLIFSD
jgi:hypothetical protein